MEVGESSTARRLDYFRQDLVLICFTEYYPSLQESLEECARYLETIKIYENKPADVIQERIDHDYLSRVMKNMQVIHSWILIIHLEAAQVILLYMLSCSVD